MRNDATVLFLQIPNYCLFVITAGDVYLVLLNKTKSLLHPNIVLNCVRCERPSPGKIWVWTSCWPGQKVHVYMVLVFKQHLVQKRESCNSSSAGSVFTMEVASPHSRSMVTHWLSHQQWRVEKDDRRRIGEKKRRKGNSRQWQAARHKAFKFWHHWNWV